ncbi:MAG: alanine racemase [bacterium]|nr:alanine racemase [bacterium]
MRLTYAEIDLAALKHNLARIKERIGAAEITAVVKANAYGHGMVPVARAALEAGASCLGVGFLEEGMRLRRAGVAAPVLVLGGVLFHQVRQYIRRELDITVSSLPLAYAVNKEAGRLGARARVHLKFDTGMNRIGMSHVDPDRVFSRLTALENLEIVGIYSHLATADEADPAFTNLQIERFGAVAESARRHGFAPRWLHLANSAAALRHPGAVFNMVRVGIAMYGIYPSAEVSREAALRPVLAFKSRVVFLKEVAAGQGVSYGLTYVTERPTRIATVPVGYGDGYWRTLSNRACVLIRGRRRPVVGRVCMDQIMVDVGPESAGAGDSAVRVGDEVVIYGRQGAEEIGVEEIAALAGTIPYEITCALAQRVPRVVVGG